MTLDASAYVGAQDGRPDASPDALLPELAALIGAIDASRPLDAPTVAATRELPVELVAFMIETDADETFRPPSTWRTPPAPPAGRSALKAAGVGVLTGLVAAAVMIGLTLALSPAAHDGPDSETALRLVREATAHAGRLSPGSILAEARLELSAARTLSRPVFEPELDEARRRIEAGDVLGARDALATAAAARSPRALFAMAETYDPNLLAAWGIRGVSADADRARALYTASLLLGHDGAEARLETLR